jgi:hypothetical protein
MREIVLPTFHEYEEATYCRRRAYLACIVVFHLADYLKKAGANDPAGMMRRQCLKGWQIVHAVATGAKHWDNLDNPNPLKFSAGTDDYRPPGVVGEMECGWSELGEEFGSIVIPTLNDGFGENVLDALKIVIQHYQSEFPGHLAIEPTLNAPNIAPTP